MTNAKEVSKKVEKNNALTNAERTLAVKLYRIMNKKGEYDLTSLKAKLKEQYTFDELTASLAWLYFHDYIIIKKIIINTENQISTVKYQIKPQNQTRTKYSLSIAS